MHPQYHGNVGILKIDCYWQGQGFRQHQDFFSLVNLGVDLGKKPHWIHWSCTTWKHRCSTHWTRWLGIQVDPFWIHLSNIEPIQCLYTHNNIRMDQERQLKYQAHMRSFSKMIFGYLWVENIFQMNASDQLWYTRYRGLYQYSITK